MKRAALILGGLFLLVSMSSAHAETPLDTARAQAGHNNYGSALSIIDGILKDNPDDFDAKLLQAQIYGWQKNYPQAEQSMTNLLLEQPKDADALVARGYLYYAEGKLPAAAQDFNAALAVAPTYADAQEGLKLVDAAKADAAASGPYKWQADVGSEFSTFARTPQTNWNDEFVQLTRFLPDSGTAVHLAVERFHQFQESDVYTEVGVDQKFNPYSSAYFYGGGTPDPGFRPRYHIATGGALRVTDQYPSMLWLTLDTRYDDYPGTEVGNLNPGLRLEIADNWAISGAMINVLQSGDAATRGGQGRLDGQILEGWRFFAGYADAPETVSGVTVMTSTVFTGTAIDLDDADTLNLAYTRDDRDNSYIRHAIDASLSRRF